MRRALGISFLIVALALAVAGASAAGKSHHRHHHKTRKVQVGDDYFSPRKITVKKGTRIRWVWRNDNQDVHNVRLGKRPKHVKRFHSGDAAAEYSYSRRLTIPGTYHIYCSFHRGMRETIVVKK